MPGIRFLTHEDLDRVAVVYEQAARSGSVVAPPGLAPAIGRLFLDAPYEGGECPALVHEDVDVAMLGEDLVRQGLRGGGVSGGAGPGDRARAECAGRW